MKTMHGPRSSLPRILSLVILVIGFALTANAAETDPGATEKIRAVLNAQAAAWNRGDIDGYMSGYGRSDATTFTSGDTLSRGWQTVRDRYKKKYDTREKMGSLSFSGLEIIPLSPDAALVLGRWQLKRKGDRPRGRFPLLLRRTAQAWRITHDHTSAALP
jgi:beta-aspartyl-peptidase (threonine type)